jgi:hypothetical protein
VPGAVGSAVDLDVGAFDPPPLHVVDLGNDADSLARVVIRLEPLAVLGLGDHDAGSVEVLARERWSAQRRGSAYGS